MIGLEEILEVGSKNRKNSFKRMISKDKDTLKHITKVFIHLYRYLSAKVESKWISICFFKHERNSASAILHS